MLFSVLQLFISVRMEKYYTFKGPSLENRLPCLFQTVGHILERRQKQWNITVKRNRSNTESDLVFHFIEEQLAQSPSNDRMKDLTTTKASRTGSTPPHGNDSTTVARNMGKIATRSNCTP